MTTSFLVAQYLILAVGLAAAAGVIAMRVRADERVRFIDVVRAGMWLAGVAGGAMLGTIAVGVVKPFGVIRIGFLLGVAAIPLVGAGLLALRAARRIGLTPAAAALAVLSCTAAPLGAWMAWVEPYDLRVETAQLVLPSERVGTSPVRIGVLADLQCDRIGDHERRAVVALLAEKPDLILVPGDIFQGSAEEWAEWREPLLELLRTVRAPHGVYFVPGDTDGQTAINTYREQTGWTVMINEVLDVQVRDRRIRIAGLANRGSFDVARDLERQPGDGDVRIVMSHAPDTVLRLEGDPRIDLVVAGHTHGGQIVVPGFGPPVTLSHVPREIARGGLHRYEGRPIYVSRGVGLERRQAPRVRLLSPPEISIVTLTSTPSRTAVAD